MFKTRAFAMRVIMSSAISFRTTKNNAKKLISATQLGRDLGKKRCFCNIQSSTIASKYFFSSAKTNLCNNRLGQRRWFLGCGKGEEAGVLSKVYEERRIMGYSPQQLFDVVAAVNFYDGFIPWCQRSEIVKWYPNGAFDAELEIGFKYVVESYISHVELNRPTSIKTTVSQSILFDHLINTWEFNSGPVPGSCDLHFLVDFKFRSPLYRQVASMFFREVVSRLVGSFSERCRLIYGPAVPVLENAMPMN